MTYNAGIPLATDLISSSQSQIKTNFSQLDAQFGVDHTAFSVGGATAGLHKQVSLPTVLAVDPVVAGTASAIYAKAVAGVAQAFFANSASVKQLTGDVTAAANGSTYLPGGIILKWGSAGTIGAPVSFVGAFPNACFGVNVTSTDLAYTGSFHVNPITAANFTVTRTSGSGATGYYYIAVGN